MQPIRNVAFVGMGAVGSIYAQCVLKNNPGACAWAVVAQKESYEKDPVTINGEPILIDLKTKEEAGKKADLIIISVKWHQLSHATEEMVPFMGDDTQILSLLNGISSEEALAQRFGWEHVLLSLGSGIDSNRTGHAVNMNRRGKILFGERRNENLSERAARVKDFFESSRIPYEIPLDMEKAMWWKLMVNVGANQVSAVYGLSYGDLVASTQAMDKMRQAQTEVIQVARALGIALSQEDITVWEEQLRSLSAQGRSSTLQDIDHKRKTEADIFGGEICRLGQKAGVPTPVNAWLLEKIREMEKEYLTIG